MQIHDLNINASYGRAGTQEAGENLDRHACANFTFNTF